MQFKKFSIILLITLGMGNLCYAANADDDNDNIKITKPSELNPQQSKLPDTLDIKDIKNAKNGTPPIKENVVGNKNETVNSVKVVPNESSPFYKRMEEINNIKNGIKNNEPQKKVLTPEEIAEEALNKKIEKQKKELELQEKEFDFEMKKMNLEQRKVEAKNKLDEAKNKKPPKVEEKNPKDTLPYYKERFELIEVVLNNNLKQLNKNIIITTVDNFLLYKNEKIAYIDKSLLSNKVSELLKVKNELDDIKIKMSLLNVGKKTNSIEIAKEIDMKLNSEITKSLQTKQVSNVNNTSVGSEKVKVREGDILESVVIIEKVDKDYVILRVN